jgi:hypothetical protein
VQSKTDVTNIFNFFSTSFHKRVCAIPLFYLKQQSIVSTLFSNRGSPKLQHLYQYLQAPTPQWAICEILGIKSAWMIDKIVVLWVKKLNMEVSTSQK